MARNVSLTVLKAPYVAAITARLAEAMAFITDQIQPIVAEIRAVQERIIESIPTFDVMELLPDDLASTILVVDGLMMGQVSDIIDSVTSQVTQMTDVIRLLVDNYGDTIPNIAAALVARFSIEASQATAIATGYVNNLEYDLTSALRDAFDPF
jgi:hypothetical protein